MKTRVEIGQTKQNTADRKWSTLVRCNFKQFYTEGFQEHYTTRKPSSLCDSPCPEKTKATSRL